MFKFLFKIVSSGQCLPVLIYHQVLPEVDPMRPFEINRAQFEKQMQWVSSYFNPVPLYEGIERLKSQQLKPGSIAVTFDDGYENNYSVALPIMKKYGVHGTFFVASDFLNGGVMWNDAILEAVRGMQPGSFDLTHLGLSKYSIPESNARFEVALDILSSLKHLPFEERHKKVEIITANTKLPGDLMMTSDMVRGLDQQGMEVGGHTKSHPILTTLDSIGVEEQIKGNKEYLEGVIGHKLRCFAYPNGKPGQDYDLSISSIVNKVGYELAVSTSAGVGRANTDMYQFPRYTPWRRSRVPFLMQMVRNYYSEPSFA